MGKDRLKLILEGKTKTECEHYAQGFRKAMRQSGQKVAGKVLVVHTTRGFAAVFKGEGWNPRRQDMTREERMSRPRGPRLSR